MECEEEDQIQFDYEDFQIQNKEDQQEHAEAEDEDVEMVDGGLEDWDQFNSAGPSLGEAVTKWSPVGPVTPQQVLQLDCYTKSKSWNKIHVIWNNRIGLITEINNQNMKLQHPATFSSKTWKDDLVSPLCFIKSHWW